MVTTFDKENLNRLLKDFYTAVGIRISIFDDTFRLVTEYPENAPEFCALIRSTERGLEGCRSCDREACERAKKLLGPHIYTCHAGITEAITPIRLGGGVLGYAILAHMLPKEEYASAVEKACDLAEKYGISREKSISAIKGISARSAEQINAAVHILDAVSVYLRVQSLATWKNDAVSVNIERYIKSNLSRELSAKVICAQFHCSRSSLHQISKRAFGTGIMEFVTYCRMENSKRMLSEGRTVTETALLNGYSDYSYFRKVFLREVGCSPSEYRKKNKAIDR